MEIHPLTGKALGNWLRTLPPNAILCTTVFPGIISRSGGEFVARFEDPARRIPTEVSVCGTNYGQRGHHSILSLCEELIDEIEKLADGLLSFHRPELPEDAVVFWGDGKVLQAIAHERILYYAGATSIHVSPPTTTLPTKAVK